MIREPATSRFLSTLSLRRATACITIITICTVSFLSTLSLRRATRLPTALRTPHQRFLSTLSLRRATSIIKTLSGGILYFYPRSPCGERLRQSRSSRGLRNFYPRSPCGERRRAEQSGNKVNHNFYPRSPCGERRGPKLGQLFRALISIHALLAESDFTTVLHWYHINKFLSTLSLRRATQHQHKQKRAHVISIHALLAESDDTYIVMEATEVEFLSTLSLRRATAFRSPRIALMVDFYPRSPCGERLLALGAVTSPAVNFYPRSPCGERPEAPVLEALSKEISIHALLAESD